ncbi:Os03g0816700, partial [Oryza sativa Japonica Group]
HFIIEVYFNTRSPQRRRAERKPTTRMAAAAAPTVVVVDARHCAAEATAFAVARVIGTTERDFAVTDAAGAVVMRLEGAVFSLRKRTLLLDAARRPVLTMTDSTYLMSSMWHAFRGDSTSRRSVLFSVVKESVVQVRTKIFVYLGGYRSADQVPDFVIGGNYYGGACTVFAGNSDSDADAAIAQITRPNLAGTLVGLTRSVYTARINPGIDQAFILSLVVILHEMHHCNTSSRNWGL